MNNFVLPAKVAIIEMSDRCNARCRWCTTGRENRKNKVGPTDDNLCSWIINRKAKEFTVDMGYVGEGITILNNRWNEVL